MGKFTNLKFWAAMLVIIAVSGLQHNLYAVPAYPNPVDYTLPDGSTITIKLRGDEWVNWRETLDGYTLLVASDGFLEYAEQDEFGDLAPSGVRARRERTEEGRRFLTGRQRNLRFSTSQQEAMRELRRIRDNAIDDFLLQESSSLQGDVNIQQSPIVGEVRVPIILVQFQGRSFVRSRNDFVMLFDQLNYTAGGTITGSLRDYFRAISYNQLDLRVTVYGPVTLPNPISHYDHRSGGSTTNFRNHTFDAARAIGFRFNNYPNPNMSGFAVSPHFIFAGYGQESGAPAGQAIWSHAASSILPQTIDGMSVRGYSCSPELRGTSGTNIAHIGVVAHELGHSLLGLPDFYDTDYEESGGQSEDLDFWCLMAAGAWGGGQGMTPTNLSAYARVRMGWVQEITLTSLTSVAISSPATQAGGTVYRINTQTPSEYFLLENRQRMGWDASIPGSGLLIYRVRRDHPGWNNNRININPADRGYYVMQAGCAIANGCWDRALDPFPRSTFTSFTDATTPSARSISGLNTSQPVTNITHNTTARSISFTFASTRPIITTQPIDRSVQVGQTAQFSVIANANGGGTMSFQWQISANGSTTWNNVTDAHGIGGTTATFTTIPTTATMNGNRYRVIVTNSGGSVTSSVVTLSTPITLTINTITEIPIVASARREVRFTAPTAGTFRFETVNNGGLDPVAYSAAIGSATVEGGGIGTGTSFSFTRTLTANQTFTFWAGVFSSSSNVSGIYTIRVVPPATPPTITTQPDDQSVFAGQTAQFSVAAAGTSPLSFQWQISTNGSTWSNVTTSHGTDGTTATFTTIGATAAMGGNRYRVTVSNSAGSVTSGVAILTLLPTITTQPENITTLAGQTAQFSVVANTNNSGTLSYQWQISTDNGSTWSNVTTANGTYGTTATFTTVATTTAMNNHRYRVVVTNSAGSVTSNSATLTVTQVHTVTYNLNGGTSASSGARNITVLMRGELSDSWSSGSSLRISVNGVNITPNPTIPNGFTTNTITFNANAGANIQVFFNRGSWPDELAFAMYYTDEPPSPVFNPAAGATNNTAQLLLHRLYGSLGSVINGTQIGSFIVTGCLLILQTVNSGSSITLPSGDCLTREGFNFAGWNTAAAGTGTNHNAGASFTPTADITLFARWIPIIYDITYNLNGGENHTTNPATYTIETPSVTLGEAERTGYAFAGWFDNAYYTGEPILEISVGSTGDKEFYAKWIPIIYSITYNLNGGTNNSSNLEEYTIESDEFALFDPAKLCYTFEGWYTSEDFAEETEMSVVPTGSIGDITLFARWKSTPSNWGEWSDWEYTATCTEDGVRSRSRTCGTCGIIDTETENIEAFGHSWVWTETAAPTCLIDGEETQICSRCQSKGDTRPIFALGHSWNDWTETTAPTCEIDGEKTRTCNRCGTVDTETQIIPALDHDWNDGETTTEPTCTQDGVKTFTCKRNSEHTRTEAIPATGHTWQPSTTPATCTTAGEEADVCSVCGEKRNVVPLPILDPSWGEWENNPDFAVIPATCQAAGTRGEIRFCERNCGRSDTRTVPIPQLEHSWVWIITTNPTCDKSGVETETCSVCGETRRTRAIDAQPCNYINCNICNPTSIRHRETENRRYGIILEENPVSDSAVIFIRTPESATVTLRIMDALGNVVFSETAADPYGRVGRQGLHFVSNPPLHSSAIIWNLTNTNGRFVANGAYLVVVEAIGVSGQRFTYSTRIGISR